jgi:hypothetical protein
MTNSECTELDGEPHICRNCGAAYVIKCTCDGIVMMKVVERLRHSSELLWEGYQFTMQVDHILTQNSRENVRLRIDPARHLGTGLLVRRAISYSGLKIIDEFNDPTFRP